MALSQAHSFSSHQRSAGSGPPRVPPILKQLDLLCPDRDVHQLPVRLRFHGLTVTRLGYVAAEYRCPFKGCKHKEVWGLSQTGHPIGLWTGKDGR